jgi:hypothetical protein
MSSSRHWNVKRHIKRRHRTMGEPVSYDTMQYYKDITPQNFRFPLAYSHHTSLSFPTPKEKPHKSFSDFLEDQILQPLRKVVEYKNLLGQLSTIQQQQGMILGGDRIQYPSMPFMTLDTEEFNNNLSEEESSLDNGNDSQTVGYRGHICEKCLVINIDTIFRHKDRESRQIETTHACNSKTLDDAQLEPNKDKTINDLYEKLPDVMKKKVNSWTENNAYLIAIEMPPNVDLNNCSEITPNNENHWAARAIKDKRTILNDEELSDFLSKARNATYAAFKVIPPYLQEQQQQQQQQESSTRCYLMIITDNKINLSFELLLQYIADLSR